MRLKNTVICPHCKHVHDAATHLGPEKVTPNDGDMNICINCQGVSEYKAGVLVAINQTEMDALPDYVLKDIRKAQMILREIKKTERH